MDADDHREAVTGLRLTIDLPEMVSSAPVARRIVAAAVAAVGPTGDPDVVELLVSELVANAVVHAHSTVSVVLTMADDSTLVEVSDRGEGWVRADTTTDLRVGGHGLQLVDALATSWGCVAHDGPGKTVWAESRPTGRSTFSGRFRTASGPRSDLRRRRLWVWARRDRVGALP